MMNDIQDGKDGVSYVLVFKLSRFGRNAADVLNSLQLMQDFGVNLICVEDGIDSSKDAGKLMPLLYLFFRKPFTKASFVIRCITERDVSYGCSLETGDF